MSHVTNQELGVRNGLDCWHYLVSQSVLRWIAVALYRIDHLHNKVTNASNPTQHSQIKFRLIYWILCGEIEHSAASDFSSILWVKRCLGNSEKPGGWGWSGVRETVKRLLNYSLLSVESAEWENCPRGEKRSRRSNRFMARMICFACLHPLEAASLHHQWNTLQQNRASLRAMYKVMGRES